MHLKRQTPCPSLPTSPCPLHSVQISSCSGSCGSDTKYGSGGCGEWGKPRGGLPSPTPTHPRQSRRHPDQGLRSTGRWHVLPAPTRNQREQSVDTPRNRGCPHKQHSPVLGQQPAAAGGAPSKLLGLQGCSLLWTHLVASATAVSTRGTRTGPRGATDAHTTRGRPMFPSCLTTGSAKP